MQEKVITIEINNEQDLAKINSENTHCVYLGDDCVHFKAFALENDNIVCYEVSDEIKDFALKKRLICINDTFLYKYINL